MDTYIYPGDTNVTRYTSDILKAGVERINNSNVVNRTLVKFNLPEIGTGSEVIGAYLYLIGYPAVSGQNIERSVEIHRITQDWDESTANWNTMNDKFDSRIESLQFIKRSTVGYNGLIEPEFSSTYNDITNLVKKWYSGINNYGIMIKSVDEQNYINDNYPAFFSKENSIAGDNPQPFIEINYRNQNGLEDYLKYFSQSFVDGKTYFNTYNGNLTAVFSLANTIASKLPASLQLIYNTNDVITKNNGFKLNLNQVIEDVVLDSMNCKKFEDEDGSIHYFYKQQDESLYHDEDGLSLTIETDGNYYYLRDKYGNKRTYTKQSDNRYYLTSMNDIDGNQLQITLNNNNEIIKVTDSSLLEINLAYSPTSIVITSPDGITTINKNANNITSIVTRNGNTLFTYNSFGIIESIKDVTGSKISYEYCEQIPYRLSGVKQYGSNDTLGQSFSVAYGYNTTSITNNDNQTITFVFDASGAVISTNIMTGDDDIDKAHSIIEERGENNKLLYNVIPIRFVKNYIRNSSFEDSNLFFSSYDNNVSVMQSSDCSVSGDKSLKIITSNGPGSIHGISEEVPFENYYTFSGYFKGNQRFKIILYSIVEYPNIREKVTAEFEGSSDWERHDVTIYAGTGLQNTILIDIEFEDDGITYIDNIQLEKGQVANDYNIIENPDFSDGIDDWSLQADKFDYSNLDEFDNPTVIPLNPNVVFQRVYFNNGTNTALKIKMDPDGTSSFSKLFPIKGKAGDVYQVSFWIKNEGLYGNEMFVDNSVIMYFKPVGHYP